MAHFTVVISEAEREELFRLLQAYLPEHRLDTIDLGYEDENLLRQEDEDLIRALLAKLRHANKRLLPCPALAV